MLQCFMGANVSAAMLRSFLSVLFSIDSKKKKLIKNVSGVIYDECFQFMYQCYLYLLIKVVSVKNHSLICVLSNFQKWLEIFNANSQLTKTKKNSFKNEISIALAQLDSSSMFLCAFRELAYNVMQLYGFGTKNLTN